MTELEADTNAREAPNDQALEWVVAERHYQYAHGPKHARAGSSTTRVLEPGVQLRTQIYAYRPPDPDELRLESGVTGVEEVVLLFGAAKFLGPFLEEFARKLGERSGEAVADALKRIRGHRSSRRQRLRIDTGTSAQNPLTTTILLPEGELSDACKLAILDLDLSAKENQGVTLRWDEKIERFWWEK